MSRIALLRIIQKLPVFKIEKELDFIAVNVKLTAAHHVNVEMKKENVMQSIKLKASTLQPYEL